MFLLFNIVKKYLLFIQLLRNTIYFHIQECITNKDMFADTLLIIVISICTALFAEGKRTHLYYYESISTNLENFIKIINRLIFL